MRLETQIRPLRRGLACVLAVLSSFVLSAASHAAEAPLVSLAWNANPESNIAGYKVHFGTQTGVYSSVVDVGKTTQTLLPQLTMGETYYVAVSAYNSQGLESPRSTEFSVTAATPAPPVGTSFTMGSGTTAGQGNLKWKYPKSAQSTVERFAVYSSEDLVNWTEAARLSTSAATSSDSQYLYFDYPYQANRRSMFFKVAPRNAFGETD